MRRERERVGILRFYIKKNFPREENKVCEMDGTISLASLKAKFKIKDGHKRASVALSAIIP